MVGRAKGASIDPLSGLAMHTRQKEDEFQNGFGFQHINWQMEYVSINC
jgi:hypothetical protein